MVYHFPGEALLTACFIAVPSNTHIPDKKQLHVIRIRYVIKLNI